MLSAAANDPNDDFLTSAFDGAEEKKDDDLFSS